MPFRPPLWRTSGLAFLLISSCCTQGCGAFRSRSTRRQKLTARVSWKRVAYITLPMLKPVSVAVLTLGTIYTVKVFDLVFIMTGGGPANGTQLLSTYAYQVGLFGLEFRRSRRHRDPDGPAGAFAEPCATAPAKKVRAKVREELPHRFLPCSTQVELNWVTFVGGLKNGS